jgi:hypothetical protein
VYEGTIKTSCGDGSVALRKFKFSLGKNISLQFIFLIESTPAQQISFV